MWVSVEPAVVCFGVTQCLSDPLVVWPCRRVGALVCLRIELCELGQVVLAGRSVLLGPPRACRCVVFV